MRFVLAIIFLVLPISSFAQQQAKAPYKPKETGLSIPRFASLRALEVNLRSGPGTHYPVTWVVKRRHLPVKVIAEYDNWRKIELHDQTTGWVFQSMLSGNKTILIKKQRTQLRRSPSLGACITAHINPCVIGQLHMCREGWCKATFQKYTGWIEQSSLWGAEFEKK